MSAAEPAAPRWSWFGRIWAFVAELWGVLRRPSSVFGLGVLALAGFVAGVVFWGGFNTALELTNTEKFCTGCHEMRDNVFAELKTTIHFSNRSGVRASCPDCHVPHNWTDKIARKMQASKEVWGHLFGSIDTREKFVDHRLELALHEWARCSRGALPSRTSVSCSPAKRPASTATRASLIIYRTCAVFRAGNRRRVRLSRLAPVVSGFSF